MTKEINARGTSLKPARQELTAKTHRAKPASKPPAKCESAGGQRGRKHLRTKNSITSRTHIGEGETTPTLSHPAEPSPRLIIAFDAEWVEEPDPPEPEGPDDEDDAERAMLRNIILSYQYACRFVLGPHEETARDCEWSGIFYTRNATAIRRPDMSEEDLALVPERFGFAELLGRAIARGIELKKLRKWPKEVIAAGHWTRADLSAMADYADVKNEFDAVHKTYVSFKPFTARFTQKDRHVRKFKVRPGGHEFAVSGRQFEA